MQNNIWDKEIVKILITKINIVKSVVLIRNV